MMSTLKTIPVGCDAAGGRVALSLCGSLTRGCFYGCGTGHILHLAGMVISAKGDKETLRPREGAERWEGGSDRCPGALSHARGTRKVQVRWTG